MIYRTRGEHAKHYPTDKYIDQFEFLMSDRLGEIILKSCLSLLYYFLLFYKVSEY
jgi:hypothetical protein